ncbi:MAG: hypothetical protein KF894_11510 [Labilithrix sp.]|nr:hypothetical protein [Labilithrix sp.]
MSIDVRASGSDLELWHVQLGGVVRTMSLDELDAAFQAGVVDERTMVLKAGALRWSTLGDAAGIDAQPNSIAPMATDIAPPSVAVGGPPAFTPAALDTAELATFRPKRRVGRALVALAAVALVGGAAFGIKSYGVDELAAKVTSLVKPPSIEGAESARATAIAPAAVDVPVALAAKPAVPASPLPSAPVDELPSATPSAAGVSIDSLPSASAAPGKADKKGKKPASPSRRKGATKAKRKAATSDPTQKGSGQFDPLDGKL